MRLIDCAEIASSNGLCWMSSLAKAQEVFVRPCAASSVMFRMDAAARDSRQGVSDNINLEKAHSMFAKS